jgi:hypothetical protein
MTTTEAIKTENILDVEGNHLSKDEAILYGRDPILKANMNMYAMLSKAQAEKATELNVKVADAGKLRTLKSSLEDGNAAKADISVTPSLQKFFDTAEKAGLTIPYAIATDGSGDKALDANGNPYIPKDKIEGLTKQVSTIIKNYSEVTKMEQMNLQMLMNQASAALNVAVSHSRNHQENFKSIMELTRR